LKQDTRIGNERNVSFTLVPKRKIHQLLLFADSTHFFKKLVFNGKNVTADSTGYAFGTRDHNGLIRYFLADNEPLEVSYVSNSPSVEFTAIEYSYDLLEHPQFSINKRTKDMMPKPFVTTDAIVVKKSFNIDSLSVKKVDSISYQIQPSNE